MKYVLYDEHDERPDGAGRHFDCSEKTEAESEDQQEINVASCNHLIDGELQVKRTGDNKHFENDRQQQNLHERMRAAVQLRPERRERKPAALISGAKTFRGRELECDTRQMLGRLGERQKFL